MPSKDVLRGILGALPDAVLAVDVDGRIVFVSDRVEKLFGWTSDEMMGQPIELLVPEALAARHAAHRATFVDNRSSRPMGTGIALLGRCKDGRTFPAEISLGTVKQADGALLVLAAVRDITERMEVELHWRQSEVADRKEQAERLEELGQLAGGIAHDFNNLIGVILNYTTVLSRKPLDSQSAADVGEIHSAAERAAALIRQLLAFARREVVNPQPLDINEVVTSFSSLLERTLGEHIHLRLDLAPETAVVSADRHQIEQILLNLAVNSRDAMPLGGWLRIATRLTDDNNGFESEPVDPTGGTHVSLRVTDTGQGMAPEVLSRAFEPFFSTKPMGQGTGLGLATVFGIVGQSNGRVAIASSPGKGTSISVVLPRVYGTLGHGVVAPEPLPGGNERILLVEDEAVPRADAGSVVIASDSGSSQ